MIPRRCGTKKARFSNRAVMSVTVIYRLAVVTALKRG